MPILLGIDFDNTIVCYDVLFHRLAVERGLVPPELPARKSNVRDYLRAAGREDAWTELQGYVYGPGIDEAPPFDGALEFLTRCPKEGVGVRIVSHKTRHPFIGPPYDLHLAAETWLTHRGFFDSGGVNLSREDVFFGLTKDDKLRRIGDLGCTHFVDDLPEFLGDPAFPSGVDRILFDPAGETTSNAFRRVGSWRELTELFFGSSGELLETAARRLLTEIGRSESFAITPYEGGGNNRVFRVDCGGASHLLKQYFDGASDARDRLRAEFTFSQFAWNQGIRTIPQPLASDPINKLALYEFVDGVRPAAIGAAEVDAALAFYRAVNDRRDAAAGVLPDAADARFSVRAHADGIDRRVERLAAATADSADTEDAAAFVRSTLRPVWHRLLSASRARAAALGLDWDATLPSSARRLSPSDFGFHNALLRQGGEVVFLDFEYAGWDDPAKLVSDFFCQPAVPVPIAFRDRFARAVAAELDDPEAFLNRCDVLWPLYQVRWVCIMLNDFLPDGSSRRRFAKPASSVAEQRAVQLRKARQALDTVAVPA